MMLGIEFLFSPDGSETLYNKNNKYAEFTEDAIELVKYLDEEIKMRFPDAHKRCTELYDTRPNFKFLRVHRFCKCNWGNSDEKLDIDLQGNWNLERVHCPLRNGYCPDENVICNPREETGLSARENEILQLIMKPDKEIANLLFISVHTVENHVRNIMRKLNLGSKGEILNYAYKHNLIK